MGRPSSFRHSVMDHPNRNSAAPTIPSRPALCRQGHTCSAFADVGRWWATLESNQAWVSPAELQSAAAPCSTSPPISPGRPGCCGRCQIRQTRMNDNPPAGLECATVRNPNRRDYANTRPTIMPSIWPALAPPSCHQPGRTCLPARWACPAAPGESFWVAGRSCRHPVNREAEPCLPDDGNWTRIRTGMDINAPRSPDVGWPGPTWLPGRHRDSVAKALAGR